jgi:hypothetical protein
MESAFNRLAWMTPPKSLVGSQYKQFTFNWPGRFDYS